MERKIAGRMLVAALLLAAGWSALWGLAAREAADRTRGWIAAEAEQGRHWSCPGLSVAGYPFALAISCDHPGYAGAALGQQATGALAGATAAVSLADPRRITVTLRGPFTFATSDGATSVEGRWSALALDLGALPTIDRVALRGRNIDLAGRFAGTAAGGRAEALDAQAALEADTAGPGLAFAATLDAASLPVVDAQWPDAAVQEC